MDSTTAFSTSLPTRHRYGHCDSFFIESDEISLAERAREQRRAIAKMRQRELASELSNITSDEYLEEVLDHMEHMESITMPDVNSIDVQQEIQWYMRPYLLDFLIEAHAAFQLLHETLFLTVNILDRYCSRRIVYKRHYQLVACAALMIAAKYGDRKERVPTFSELRSVCCQLYEEEMFMQMEWHVLQTLDYVLGHPTVDSFLEIALANQGASHDAELMHMTWYVCEITLYYRDFVSIRPSVLARSALALARAVLGRPSGAPESWAGRFESDVIMKMLHYIANPSQVIVRKYSSTKLSTAAQNVEYFLRSQQQPETTVHDPDSGYGTPSTPHKTTMYSAPLVQHGCMTPPITPSNSTNACVGFNPPPPNLPSTPSPTPSHHLQSGSNQCSVGSHLVFQVDGGQ